MKLKDIADRLDKVGILGKLEYAISGVGISDILVNNTGIASTYIKMITLIWLCGAVLLYEIYIKYS